MLTNFGLFRVWAFAQAREKHHNRLRLPGNSSNRINVMLPVQSFPKK